MSVVDLNPDTFQKLAASARLRFASNFESVKANTSEQCVSY